MTGWGQQGRAAPAGGADTRRGVRARWAMSRGVSPGQCWLGAATLLCGVGGREVVDWPVALLPRWGTRCSRWVLQFLCWVRSSLLAPCLLGFRHPLVFAGTIRPDGRSRRVPPCSPGQQGRGTSRPPRGMGAGALRGGCPGSPSLGLTGSVLCLLLPRTPSPGPVLGNAVCFGRRVPNSCLC